MILQAFLITLISTIGLCDVRHLNYEVTPTTEYYESPRPYAFGYAAGRYPGNIDRTHSEISDGSGVIRGTFSYVDPRFKIRTVEYVADKDGFHPHLNQVPPPLPADSPVVAAAKQRHLVQYAAIANSHQSPQENVVLPGDTAAVENAKLKHFKLYNKIAEEHARLSAETAAREIPIHQEYGEQEKVRGLNYYQ
ncbi:cuticle protein 6 [Agrilus planipennis]|uniref:Cuticle protein 6 n=1 Tax=Agrilus planipennis TaxID=224129 RepID=A0A1W4XMT9_AGRPL|nr:cuticle protein 6 [Agrilus planipennis]